MATKIAVRRGKPELIVPSKPTPQEIKLLSDIDDQQGLRYHYPTIMFYEAMKGKLKDDPVKVIKEALAKALVYYYPYAGRLIEGPNKKLMVNCTAEGVLFVEGITEVRLEQLRNFMYPPCQGLEEFLLDIPAGSTSRMVGSPLMLIQVTRLQCGGFVVAVLLNHVMSDGLGKVQFLNAVSQMAKGNLSSSSPEPSPIPSWGRQLFIARNPLPPLPSSSFNFLHNEFDIVVTNADSDNKNITQMSSNETLIRQSFLFGQKEIKSIKDQLPLHMQSSLSKFKLITAFLWRCRTKALNLDKNDELVTLTFFFNFRGIKSKNFQQFKLPNGYYGNAVVSTAAVTSGKKLCNNPLSYAVELMTQAKEKVMTNGDCYVKSYLDFMAFHGKPGFMKNKGAWVVSDSSRVGFHEVDFGWGKPVYGGPMDGSTFYYNSVYSPGQSNNGSEVGVLAPICLPVLAMDKLKEEVRKLNVSKHIRPATSKL